MAKHRVVAAIITAPAQLLEEADQPQLLACRPRLAENDAVAAGVVTSGGFGVSLTRGLPALAPCTTGPWDSPVERGLDRRSRLIEVGAVEAEARFEPQAVARAKPDRGYRAIAQQSASAACAGTLISKPSSPV